MDPQTAELTALVPQKTYMHGDRTLVFHRCSQCGITTHWSGVDPAIPNRMKINFTTADEAFPANLPVRHFDGADSWEYLD
ncbi:hypothetical protein V0U79_02205 [Hyphobacterium sp. HN65]|uniref:CENP-V/GFA domain-containing protein n=1 Tax=Hyphobacterium lacteum TaxID=3116575 RepID=A0ABU7LMQ8_9PROT|nr:hypothetical protein [Hyphobacterium sp. HN65]MEE2525162.1 hypothetical protein [Hyphobacterium sp. HN65]